MNGRDVYKRQAPRSLAASEEESPLATENCPPFIRRANSEKLKGKSLSLIHI